MLFSLLTRKTLSCTLCSLVLVGVSIASWFLIPVEILPKENIPPYLMVRVNAAYSQDTDLVEMVLAIPVEGALKTVSRVVSLKSSVDSRGVSVSLGLKPGTDLDMATIQIYEALGGLAESEVLDLNQVSVTRLNPDAIAVLKLSATLSAQNAGGAPIDLKELREQIKISLESVAGVAKTEVIGMESSYMSAELSVAALRKNSLSAERVANRLRRPVLNEKLGDMQIGQGQLPIFAKTRPPEMEDSLIQPLSATNPIGLRSLASVELFEKSKKEILHQDAEQAFFIEIFPKDSANLFAVNDGVTDAIQALSVKYQDKGLKIATVFNLTDELKKAMGEVFSSLYQAMLITFIIVFLFYRNLLQTFLINISIPLTLILTVFMLYLSGKSLNILTLSGLILGIGLVVDNAALLIERVDELIVKMSSRTAHFSKIACGQAASDVSMALIMSTVTNALIFLPLIFIEGSDSFIDLLRAFQIPILGSLFGSLIVSLVFLPLIRMIWKRETAVVFESTAPSKSRALFKKVYSLKWPIAALCVVGFLFLCDRISEMDSSDLETPRDPYVSLTAKFSFEVPSPERKKMFLDLEQDLMKQKATLGFRILLSNFIPTTTGGSLVFYPVTSNESNEDPDDVLKNLENRLKEYLNTRPPIVGLQLDLGFGSFAANASKPRFFISLEAPSQRSVDQAFLGIKTDLLKIEGVTEIKLEKEELGQKQYVLLPRYDQMKTYGIELGQLITAINTHVNPTTIEPLQLNGEASALKITVLPRINSPWTIEEILDIDLEIKSGSLKIRELLDPVFAPVAAGLQRKERKNQWRLFVYHDPLKPTNAMRTQVTSVLGKYVFPPGIGLAKDDSYLRVLEMEKKTQFIVVLSIGLIYLVLAGIFESLLLPLSIIFSIPLALIFGAAGLWVLGLPLDVMGRLGLVMLVGIGVNNAIILIDMILNLRSQGFRRQEAILLGCAKRLKAIAMTTTIQVISVLPVALGKSKLMGIPYSSLGIVIISGMILSTLITLVVLPLIYEIFDDLEEKLFHKAGTKVVP